MKIKKRKNYVNEVSCVYIAADFARRTIGLLKCGETFQQLWKRRNKIRSEDKCPKLQMIATIVLFNVTQAQRRTIESEVRECLEKYALNIGNDYFTFDASSKRDLGGKYFRLTALAMAHAIDVCEEKGHEYYFTWL